MFCRLIWITLGFGALLTSGCVTAPLQYRNDPYRDAPVSDQHRDCDDHVRANRSMRSPSTGSGENGLRALTQELDEIKAKTTASSGRHDSNLKTIQQLDGEIAQVQKKVARNTERLDNYRQAIGEINDMLGNLPQSESPEYLANKRERLLSERTALKRQWSTLHRTDSNDRQRMNDLEQLRSETILSRRYRDQPSSSSPWISEGTNKLGDINARHGFR